jgi:hypothetical protein
MATTTVLSLLKGRLFSDPQYVHYIDPLGVPTEDDGRIVARQLCSKAKKSFNVITLTPSETATCAACCRKAARSGMDE